MIKITTARVTDIPQLIRMNEAAVPHVNSIDEEEFRWFMEFSSDFYVARSGGQVAGFLIVLPPNVEYDSPNYRFFSKAFAEFRYVDRIVIAENYRGNAIGSKLYSELFFRKEAPVVCCEVNIHPPNRPSMAFHHIHGFREVDTLLNEEEGKKVSLMVKEL